MRFRARLLIIGLSLLVGMMLVWGERRMPTGPGGWAASEPGLVGAALSQEIQVATFNIHGCKGLDGKRDVARIGQLIRDVDIVGLNEVHGSLWKTPQDQISHLGGFCGVPAANLIYAPAETQWFGTRRFGNGLLARGPLLAWQRIPLPRRDDRSCRNMLLAQVGWSQAALTVLVTHVTRSSQREREVQLEAVLDLFGSLDPPAILLADLNTPPGDPRMARFLAESDAVDAIAAGGESGRDRVDWILVRGLTCRDAKRLDTDASDHPLFTVRLARAPAQSARASAEVVR